jgi:hypothetical protein
MMPFKLMSIRYEKRLITSWHQENIAVLRSIYGSGMKTNDNYKAEVTPDKNIWWT